MGRRPPACLQTEIRVSHPERLGTPFRVIAIPAPWKRLFACWRPVCPLPVSTVTSLLKSPEFALLAATTARPPLDHHRAAIGAAAEPGQIDWPFFLKLIDRHRVAPLVFDALTGLRDAIPDMVFGELRAKALRDRTQALQTIGVSGIVQARLADAGIAAVSIKGPTLAQLAFGDPTLRQCRDLDVLIPPDRVEDALRALQAAGFRLVEPKDVDVPGRLAVWVRLMKDLTLLQESTGILVELHWRLNNNFHLLPADVALSRERLSLGATDVWTLGAEDLLLYLCVHGAKHQWFRLKWLADVYALLAQGGAKSHDRLMAQARARGVDVAAEQMFLVLNAVYAPALPAVGVTRRGQSLSKLAQRMLSRIDEPGKSNFTGMAMAMGQMLLRREPRYVLREVVMLAIDWPVVLALNGRRFAYPLSIVGRPLFWIRRKLRQSSQ